MTQLSETVSHLEVDLGRNVATLSYKRFTEYTDDDTPTKIESLVVEFACECVVRVDFDGGGVNRKAENPCGLHRKSKT